MDLKQILELLLLLLGPIISIGFIKGLLSKAVEAVSGQYLKLSRTPKLILSLAFTFVFIALLSAQGVEGMPAAQQSRWMEVLLTLVSKAIYDFYNDLKKP